MLNLVSQQTPKINRGERKQQRLLESNKKKNPAKLQESENTSQ
jgi:hypothetical protein